MPLSSEKVVVTCALTGVLTDPKMHRVPVTAKEMAQSAREAFDAGATVVHCHFRNPLPDHGHLPTWEVTIVRDICAAIRTAVPDIILNLSTGVFGSDISGPLSCLKAVRPESAALNCGSMNYLKVTQTGQWAWSPLLFDNPVEKISDFLETMTALNIRPECECFDSGMLRSLKLFEQVGLLTKFYSISLVMGVQSGMPLNHHWLPLLIKEMPPEPHWQVIAIGRKEVWPVLQKAIELGGHIRSGLEDTFYLPTGEKTQSNGKLIEAAVDLVHQSGRSVASPLDARKLLKI